MMDKDLEADCMKLVMAIRETLVWLSRVGCMLMGHSTSDSRISAPWMFNRACLPVSTATRRSRVSKINLVE